MKSRDPKRLHSRGEVYCKQIFARHLTRIFDPGQVNWRDGDEPPDYYVVAKGVRYAVEVTTLMEMVQLDSIEHPSATIVHSLFSLVRRVEELASNEGTLKGDYAVSFSRPITNLGRFRDCIVEDLLNYIERTRNDESAQRETVFRQGGERYSVQKLGIRSSKVSPVFMGQVKWEDGIREEACRLLQLAVTTKSQKLSCVILPIILLLLDEYGFAKTADFKQCIPTVPLLEDFHTVFLVRSANEGCVLHGGDFDVHEMPGTFLIDSCAFDPKHEPEKKAAIRVLRAHKQGTFILEIAYSTKWEIDHPGTPASVKKEASEMIYTIQVSLEAEERKKLRMIEDTLQGSGKRENIIADARHIFEAQKYGGGFITTDGRIIRKKPALEQLPGMRISIYRPSEFMVFMTKELDRLRRGSS